MLISTETWMKLEKAARDVVVNPDNENLSGLREILDHLESIRGGRRITLRYYGTQNDLRKAISVVRSMYELRLNDVIPFMRSGTSFDIPVIHDGYRTDEDIERLREVGFEVEISK